MYSHSQFFLRKPLPGVKVCRLPGCKRPLDPGLSLCAMHQRQANRHGIPEPVRSYSGTSQGGRKATLRNNPQLLTRAYICAARTWITDQTRRIGTKGRYRVNRPRNETLAIALAELNAFIEFRCTESLRISDLGRPRLKPERKARAIFKALRTRFGDLAPHAILSVLIGAQLAVEVEGEGNEATDPRFLRAAQFRALWTLCRTPKGGRTNVLKGCKRPQLAGRYLHQAIDRLVTSKFLPYLLTKDAKKAILKKTTEAKYGNPQWGVWMGRNLKHMKGDQS